MKGVEFWQTFFSIEVILSLLFTLSYDMLYLLISAVQFELLKMYSQATRVP